MECIQVLPSHIDDIVETAQLVVNHLLPKGTEAHKSMYSIILEAQESRNESLESTYSTRVMNPLSINIELVLVSALWQLHYC